MDKGGFRHSVIGQWPLFLVMGLVIWLIRPMAHPFQVGYSTVVLDAQGRLLRATLAGDGQLRFPPGDEPLPAKYVDCLVACEDRRFGRHPGVDPRGLVRAVVANIKGQGRIQGGSTLAMQIARLAHPKARTLEAKIREAAFALRLSAHFSSDQILTLYAAHAPMGGNTVGLAAAARRYFGKPPVQLTWAEAALLAVLPNAPSDLNLDRRRPALLDKRNRLLRRLVALGKLDGVTAELACAEPLPQGPGPLPFAAPHLTGRLASEQTNGGIVPLWLDRDIQRNVADLAAVHHRRLAQKGIRNLAVLTAETASGRVRAYIGSQSFLDSLGQGQVDGVMARRSTGSLLKPYLVAKVLDRGPYTLSSRVLDVPTFFGNFLPQNASKRFAGLVSLESVLVYSLNVPAVRLLNYYGLEDFYDDLKAAGFGGLFRTAEGYGLPLILGGAEASLWEMVRLYLSLGNGGTLTKPVLFQGGDDVPSGDRICSPGTAWLVLGALAKLRRPGDEAFWQSYSRQVPVAWKTGTSYGQKDGWALGVNAQWTIGVWVGNFTGEGNAAVSGAGAAAPLLFSLFNRLSDPGKPLWFDEPEADLVNVEVCDASGFPAGPNCPHKHVEQRPAGAWRAGVCPYHRRYLLDDRTNRSVCSLCWTEGHTHWDTLFIVPAAAQALLAARAAAVDAIPRHNAHCPREQDRSRFDIVYPTPDIKIVVPRDYDGERERVVLAAKHQQTGMHCFWYLNQRFIGETQGPHERSLTLDPGAYTLTVQDEEGFTRSVAFTVYYQ